MLTLTILFAFSVTCFAAQSPTQTAIPTKEHGGGGGDEGSGGSGNGNGGGADRGSVSPKTGMAFGGVMVAMITAGGVVVISRKKYSEE